MARDQEIPKRHPSGQHPKPREDGRQVPPPRSRQVPSPEQKAGSSRSSEPRPADNAGTPAQRTEAYRSRNPQTNRYAATVQQPATTQKVRGQRTRSTVVPPPPGPTLDPSGQSAVLERSRWQKLLYNWKLWVALTAVACAGSGVFAVMLLLQIPGLPNCPAIFWPLASASLRFECARLAASKQTPKDLLEAIALIDSLPSNHPLREEADRLVEQWSQDVLRLADEDFNAGKLADAIAAARRIPSRVTAHKLVEERIKKWQSIWAEAEAIYKKAEDYLRKQDFRQAFAQAVRLLDVDNRYWQTTRFDQLTNIITITRNDGTKLGRAYRLADEGGLNNLLEAIKLADSIRPESYIFQAAQAAIPKFGRKMLEMAQSAIDRRELKTALNILDKIPDKAGLKDEVRDFTILANAQSQVWQNTVPAVEEAISQAQRISAGSPLYQKAQQLIARWQLEIEAIAQLEKARTTAQSGALEDLAAGIAEASLVPRTNPRWNEAQQQIQRWKAQIETVQDQPTLDQADQLASGGDLASLQAAITQAAQIVQGRALYGASRSRIQKWTAQIQSIQDEPILLQAREYANAGDLKSAINLAQQIQSGRSLYSDAQTDVRRWRNQVEAATTRAQTAAALQEARNLANSGSPTSLAKAIEMVSQVSASAMQGEVSNAINEWSQQLLTVAKSQADYDVPGAIALAQKIPSRASSYSEAQQLVKTWKQSLGL